MAPSAAGTAFRLPMQHLSIRVPWHDHGWDGTVCQNPADNTSCLVLSRISATRQDAAETAVRGRHWDTLEADQWPACQAERGAFMADRELTRVVEHPYAETSPAHTHFAPTPFRYPAYSAACIPFGWMLKEQAAEQVERLGIPFDQDAEDRLHEEMGFETTWIQVKKNQLALEDTFFGAIVPHQSLCFFYAKDTPLADESRRAIVGAGLVTHVGDGVEYHYSQPGEHRAMLWERAVQHSIRPKGGEGFLFPYSELLALREREPDLDLSPYVAFAPEEAFWEFSFTAEHVSHDAAVAALITCAEAIRRIGTILPGNYSTQQTWLDSQINRLWKLRGPHPGFGAALKALGLENGALVAYEIGLAQTQAANEWKEDPWILFEQALKDPSLLGRTGKSLGKTVRETYFNLKPTRRALLRLLSRFSLTEDQATRFYESSTRRDCGIEVKDDELVANPFLLYELDRAQPDPIPLAVIDRGMYADPVVLERFPIPEPSAPDGALDERRVRAFAVWQLEQAASNGHTLLPTGPLLQSIRNAAVQPPCLVTEDVLDSVNATFVPAVVGAEMADGSSAWQLGRLAEIGEIIRRSVSRRIEGQRHEAKHDWRAVVDRAISASAGRPATAAGESALDSLEERARDEKAAALKELFEARVSVLVGPAGTGKTTLLSALCGLPEIERDGLLLLAPTGKARVRMETQVKAGRAQTVAQFLIGLDRYDPDTGRYLVKTGKDPVSGYGTVIVDEASMLTEEQLAAVIDAVKNPKRLVLVGDPQQLPPIGSGRPFVDIVRKLAPADVATRFPKVAAGYAELTVKRRHLGQHRTDLLLAEWFTNRDPGAGGDEIWDLVTHGTASPFIKLIRWQTEEELEQLLLAEIVGELGLNGPDDENGFEVTLGGEPFGSAVYFRETRKDSPGAGPKAESWQILSPVRGGRAGVEDLNRRIQERFRKRALSWAEPEDPRWRKTAKPMGRHRILYGDKVINVINHRHKDVWPDGSDQYVANGEIGIVVGQYKGKAWKPRRLPWKLEVEFSSQAGFKYGYGARDFNEEMSQTLELAYALTVHKTQGSEFGRSFVVLPNPCRLLSPELLYTALTRQRDRIIIFHQGDLAALRKYSRTHYSETARRLTNLFAAPRPMVLDGRPLEEGLIHRTRRGEAVRSKSEVIVADVMFSLGIDYEYERELHDELGQRRWPDFTIEDQETGLIVYWEHLGLLEDPWYRERWERKLGWYRSLGIIPFEEGGGPNGVLVTTADSRGGAIDSAQIEALARKVFKR